MFVCILTVICASVPVPNMLVTSASVIISGLADLLSFLFITANIYNPETVGALWIKLEVASLITLINYCSSNKTLVA